MDADIVLFEKSLNCDNLMYCSTAILRRKNQHLFEKSRNLVLNVCFIYLNLFLRLL